MPDFLPIMLKTKDLPCLVVGGGKIAFRKVLVLLRFKLKLTIVAKQLEPRMMKLVQRKLVDWRPKYFSPSDLLGKKMVVAATNDTRINRKVAWWAAFFKIYYNTVDNIELSNFIFPAIYRNGALTVAISTQGYYPAASRKVKRDIVKYFGRDYGQYLEQLCRFRNFLKVNESDMKMKRFLLNRLLRMDIETVNKWDDNFFKEWLRHEYEAIGSDRNRFS